MKVMVQVVSRAPDHQKVNCHEEDLDTRDVHQPPRKATFSLLKAITIT